MVKVRAAANRTLTCAPEEIAELAPHLLELEQPCRPEELEGRIINQELGAALKFLPPSFVDLMILDPPYNLAKDFHGRIFRQRQRADYQEWFRKLLLGLKPLLKPQASLYVCSDWRTSLIIAPLLEESFQLRNRITWEREKGRGARKNWKNNSEDIWFCTVGKEYFFDIEAVKLKRRVRAPYRDSRHTPKDWQEEGGERFRLTHPSNLWSDITVPFWSMPENTDHPTQKPEKLLAKLILASSRKGDFVFDPFLGSGTSTVVAAKLGRRFCGIEINREYCCWALKRLARARRQPAIQGYADGIFWERNSLKPQPSQQSHTIRHET
jgi:site-specific DNA-methyltransferase (adenine-specific)